MPDGNAIILILKEPVPGKVKTRLGKTMGMKAAAQLYTLFLQSLKANLTRTDWGIRIFYESEGPPSVLKKIFGAHARYYPQAVGNLGYRMEEAFRICFESGDHRVCALGGDSPDLPVEFLHEAFAALGKRDVAVGPCRDGGYYLIGLNAFRPEIFKDISWSSDQVFAQTLQNFKTNKLTFAVMPQWYDIDTPEDYQNLVLRNPAFKLQPGIAPRQT